ncbi:type II secretion system protein N [Pseudoruegeria sp. HB172150]|uniref:type II secretion system protein N n=1 Tax=Pseudoruegeria sp. HB172150 TaxID=2721164 RepID=UPI00155408BE|nr:type II secretion system protein N [Pseudoruegeria sp. HB172150]
MGKPTKDNAPEIAREWPPVFGIAPLPAEATPAAAPLPEPELRYDYRLTGLVADAQDGWALVSSGGIQQVVRPGDRLEGGETVTAIDAQGVHILWRGQRQLIPVQRPETGHLARDMRPAANLGNRP